VRIDVGACSDAGRKNTHNEDSYRVVREMGLFVVSDGIGGQAKGEAASEITVEAVTKHCSQTDSAAPSAIRELRPGLSARTNQLASAVRWANRRIRAAASRDSAYLGMGATVVAAWLNDEQLSVVSVGDSRAYLFRAGALRQLTNDHSLAAERARRGFTTKQEAELSPSQNVLLRALGTDDKVHPDADEVALQLGDIVVLCTDGLTHMVTDSELSGVLSAFESAQIATDRLIDLANSHGGKDNITVVVLRIESDANGLMQWVRRRLHPEGVN
jgi:serine/threonine protein phosphatase PrpC